MSIRFSSQFRQFKDIAWFVARCTVSAASACWLSDALGMDHTVWASMSALIVSQEKLEATRRHVAGRIAGTMIGALVALAVHQLANRLSLDVVAQIAVAVAICAVIAKGRPILRVCLWTCPLVLLTTSPSISPEITALSRTAEVLIGAIIGGGFHFLEAAILGQLTQKPGQEAKQGFPPSDTRSPKRPLGDLPVSGD